MSRWFRHYASLCSDAKFGGIARRAKATRERAVFVFLCILEQAAEKNDGGAYVWDADAVADILNCDTDDVEKIHVEMIAAELVTGNLVAKWKERQFESDVSTDRVARFRNKKKQKSNVSDESGNVDETLHHVSATPPENRDIDTSSLRSDGGSPPPDPDRELFARGREVLGKSAGGQVAKLKAAYGGSIPKARAAIEIASTKDRPTEWVAATIGKLNDRTATGPPRNDPEEIRDTTTRALVKLAAEYSH